MKTLAKVFVCAALLVSVPSLVSAQVGYTVADFNGTAPQRLYRFDVNVGALEDLGTINTNTEQEGLFSTGSALFGYSEFDPALASADLQNPGTRFLPTLGGANPNPAICSFPQARFGSESGAAFNPVDGFVYVVNSNDNPADGEVGSRFFRFKPNCSGFQQLGAGTSTYVDGVAVSAAGTIYMSDFRLTDRVYTFNLNGTLTPLPQTLGFPINLDSGLAYDFENDRLLGLAENGTIYTINIATGAGSLLSTLTLNGAAAPTDLEGFDIPIQSPIP